jgi:O-antigen ligase
MAAVSSFLAAPRFVTAVTTATVGVAVFAFALRQTVGWAGLIAIIATLVLLAGASIAARWDTIEWRGLLPISLTVFVGWAGLSILWSQYRWATAGGLAYLACFTIFGIYVALLRDTIQIVRAFGDVLRFALAVSIVIEIISGLLIDSPIRFLQVLGKLDQLGPIQGITGARNQLGFLAVVALITFGTEFSTHLISRGMSAGSIVLAGIVLLLTRSPLAFGTLLLVCVAGAALFLLRRVKPDRQRFWQIAFLLITVIASALAWAFRSSIVSIFNAGGDLTYRLDLWREAWNLISFKTLQGWGWVGTWRDDIAPFQLFSGLSARDETSASNAFLDVWLQLGLVGLAIFVGLVGLALVRSWLFASRQRSVVFAWPALVVVALVVTALGESSFLVEFGWLTFVACCVKAAGELSWRAAFATPLVPDLRNRTDG